MSNAADEPKALNYDAEKLRYDLVPPDAFEEVVRVYTQGAKKYAPRNWEKGMEWSRVLASLKRHVAEWEKGNDKDSETSCFHMASVAFRAMQLLAYTLRGAGTDDRPTIPYTTG